MAEILTAIDDAVEATLSAEVTWQAAIKRAVRSGRELCRQLQLPEDVACPAAEADFPVFAPLEYIARMAPGVADDPLLLQVLASAAETVPQPTARLDPVGDAAAERLPGLLQKYDHRALLIATGACAIHCRYCFRRHYPYQSAPIGPSGWQSALDEIARDHSLDEIILSGGDPLTLADASLAWLISRIGQIKHIRRLRIHTRLPVVVPQRVCPPLVDWLRGSAVPVFFVLHFNHAAEIDPAVLQSLGQLRHAGATLLNQAVMLSNVNDSLEAQRDLCSALVNAQVLPYYLHQLDAVQGAMHFGVPDERAMAIVRGLADHLPGYAVPKLVREVPGERSKRRLL